jgi:hypothetical protein
MGLEHLERLVPRDIRDLDQVRAATLGIMPAAGARQRSARARSGHAPMAAKNKFLAKNNKSSTK